MKHGLVKSVLIHFYHLGAYHVYARASSYLAGVYIATPSDDLAKLQRRATMKAHTHRVRAEDVISICDHALTVELPSGQFRCKCGRAYSNPANIPNSPIQPEQPPSV